MKQVRVWAAALMLAAPSYAWSQSAEGLLGQPLPEIQAGAAASPLPKTLNGEGRPGAALARGLAKVQHEERAATRGSAETKVYREAAPAVVLILAEDGFGSGALISADGQILTNYHVVGDASVVGVVFKPKTEGAAIGKGDLLRAKVIKRDEIADLALIKVEAPPAGVAPLKLGAPGTVQVGEDVSAIGHPTGESWTYTRGIVSQIRQDYVWRYDDEVEHRAAVIQTQTPINPGNSGGPLLDDELRIVGVNSFGGDGEGLNFAVSADDVRAFLARPGDRLARKPPAKTATRKKTCEMEELGSSRTKKDRGVYRSIDVDCDGKSDFVMFEPDDEDEAWAYLFDDDKNGEFDTVILDTDHDGEFDYALYDTDGDGEPDMRGEYRKGEDEPYRLERL